MKGGTLHAGAGDYRAQSGLGLRVRGFGLRRNWGSGMLTIFLML